MSTSTSSMAAPERCTRPWLDPTLPIHPMNLRLPLRCLIGITALLSSACGSYKGDIENACHAVERSGTRKEMANEYGKPIAEYQVVPVSIGWAMSRAQSEEG